MARPRIRSDNRSRNMADNQINAAGEHLLPEHISDSHEDRSYENRSMWESLKGDRKSVALLIFLYVLQGIPLGLAGSIPYLFSSRHVHYQDQAIFSFVYWPFSVKLLWAPIVDSLYLHRFGRRKSWLVPVQFLIGAFMLGLSPFIPQLLGEEELGGEPGKVNTAPVHVIPLTVIFFALNFLAATQDIAVDGWALTMLSR